MNIVTIEEQTFKQVCERFISFANQVERICKQSNHQSENGFPVRKYALCLVSASEVYKTIGTVGNWLILKLAINCITNLLILKDWLLNVQLAINQTRKIIIHQQRNK